MVSCRISASSRAGPLGERGRDFSKMLVLQLISEMHILFNEKSSAAFKEAASKQGQRGAVKSGWSADTCCAWNRAGEPCSQSIFVDLLVRAVIEHELPFNSVEKGSIRNLLNYLSDKHRHISAETANRRVVRNRQSWYSMPAELRFSCLVHH